MHICLNTAKPDYKTLRHGHTTKHRHTNTLQQVIVFDTTLLCFSIELVFLHFVTFTHLPLTVGQEQLYRQGLFDLWPTVVRIRKTQHFQGQVGT